jgi:hypothetical protein
MSRNWASLSLWDYADVCRKYASDERHEKIEVFEANKRLGRLISDSLTKAMENL